MEDPTVSQFFSHDTGQGTAIGLGNIRHAKLGRVQLIAGAQSHDQGDIQPTRRIQQVQFAAYQINSVYNIIISAAFRKENITMRAVVKAMDRVEDGVGVNISDAGSYGLCLGQPNGGSGGFQLTVDV